MIKLVKTTLLIIFLVLVVNCEKSTKPEDSISTVTDVDGNIYKTIKIGDQWWMAENLKVIHYRNGELISDVWVYDDNETNAESYGRLYSWHAVNDSRNIAPSGWHIPTDAEWKELEMQIGMSRSEADDDGYRGTDEGSKLKSTTGWNSDGNGTDDYDFAALSAGYRSIHGGFYLTGKDTDFWSSSEQSSDHAWHRRLDYGYSKIRRFYTIKGNGFSIRCVKN